MAPIKSLVVLSVLSGVALTSPVYGSPCASVSAAVASAAPSTVPTVPAQLAYDCLQSVPLGKETALGLVDAIRPYFNWQSSTAYLKDPPEEYTERIQEAVDIFGGLDEIKSKIESDSYKSEYEVYKITRPIHMIPAELPSNEAPTQSTNAHDYSLDGSSTRYCKVRSKFKMYFEN